jgi:hypothetical protein
MKRIGTAAARWLLLAGVASCLPPIARPADNAIDLRYRVPAAHSTATDVYQAIGARSLAVQSRCKMVPTDSEMFAARTTSDCGGIRTWYWGMSRVLLERASSPRFMTPIFLEGRLRWMDLPEPCR